MNKGELDMVCSFIRVRYEDRGGVEFVATDPGRLLEAVRSALDPILGPLQLAEDPILRPKTEIEKLKDEVYLLRGKVNDMEMRMRGTR